MESKLIVSDKWKDFQIIDSGDGQKLEKWDKFILLRPEPQAVWTKNDDKLWSRADAVYTRSSKGGGQWNYYKSIPESWNITYGNMVLKVHPTGFKHTGLFPEQAANWDWITNTIKEKKANNIINLFGYTGAATVASALAGANVCHVDASKGTVNWCKENLQLSKVEQNKVRLIVDDCMKFIQREERRNKKYDGIIMDPPSFGRGASGEVWKLEKNLWDLLLSCKNILSENPKFILINSYTSGLSPLAVYNISMDCFGGMFNKNSVIECGEIGLPFRKNRRVLPCGTYCRIVF